MKLNNKGFAITAVLYGILILFVLMVSSYLMILSARKNKLDSIISDIEDGYNNVDIKKEIPNIIEELPLDKIPDFNDIEGRINDKITDNNISIEDPVILDDKVVIISQDINDNFKVDIRYSGSDPSNYVYFNCSDYNNQSASTCKVWRIIGIVDGKIKLISNESIGKYVWDTDINEWSTSDIEKTLNSSSLNYFTSKTVNLIADATWYLGGYSNWEVEPNIMLWYERSDNVTRRPADGTPRSITWKGKIALPYPSDYGYAADMKTCNETFNHYSKCYENNWMAKMFKKELTWLITPYVVSDNVVANRAWFADDNGALQSNGEVFYEGEIYPTVYLADNVKVSNSGGIDTGTKESPYHLEVSNG